MVITCPRTFAKAKRTSIQFRDVREHRKIHMAYLLGSHDWQDRTYQAWNLSNFDKVLFAINFEAMYQGLDELI